MLKFKKLMAILLATATLTGCTISLNSVQAFAKENKKATAIEDLKVYNSTVAIQNNNANMKIVANAKFFEDSYDDKRTVFLSTDGSFINSDLKQQGSYWYGSMYWASGYWCSMNVTDRENTGGETQIVSSTPKNMIKSSRVSNTVGYSVGYSVGGTIGVLKDAKTVTFTASYNQSQNISYDQENYTTLQDKDTTKEVSWKVQFDSMPNGLGRHSFANPYGNEMFMNSRLKNTGINNLTQLDKLPTLISGGFSPNFLIALKAPKNKKETIVDVTLRRQTDFYDLHWSVGKWLGNNAYDHETKAVQRFVIDWDKHTIKTIEQFNKEKETKEIRALIKKLNHEDNDIMETMPTTQDKIKLKQRVGQLEKEKKIERMFEENPNETEYLANGGVILHGKWKWEIVK